MNLKLGKINRPIHTHQVGTYSKLQQKKYSPYKILRKINDAYAIDFLNTMSISNTFNIFDIYEFHTENEIKDVNSRTSSSKVRENDEDTSTDLAFHHTWWILNCHTVTYLRD